MKEIQANIVSEVNQAYAQFRDCAGRWKQIQIEGANLAVKVGMLLIEYKRTCPRGEFQRAFASIAGKPVSNNRFEMSYDHGSLLMRIANRYRYDGPFTAENYPERARSLHDLLYAANELPLPDGHGEQTFRATEQNVFLALSAPLMKFCVTYEKQRTLHPVEQWSQDTAAQFAAEMEPIVEQVLAIYEAARARASDSE